MYVFRGTEPRPFVVGHPFDLYERHRTLICEHLGDDTPLLTLYCPVWKGEDGIWGHQNPHASTAICLTNRHWLISFDFHNERSPKVLRVAHQNVLSAEIGRALLLGWFRLNYLDENDDFVRTDILFNTHVFTYFRQLLGLWRFFNRNKSLPKSTGRFLNEGEQPFLLLPDETITFQLNLPAVKQKRRRKLFVKAHQTQILPTSEKFLLFTVREASPEPEQLTFAEAFHAWDIAHAKARFSIRAFNEGIDLLMIYRHKDVLRLHIFKEQISFNDLKALTTVLHTTEGASHAVRTSASS